MVIMLDEPRAGLVAVQELTADDFYVPRNRDSFEVIKLHLRTDGVSDAMRLASELEVEKGWSYQAAKDYVQRFVVGHPCSPASIGSYCRQLRALTKRRACIQAAGELLSGNKGLAEVRGVLDELDRPDEITESGSVAAMREQINAEVKGTRYAVEFPDWRTISLTQCLLPGSITLICGSPGVSKSLFVLEPTWRWMLAGEQASALELEKGGTFHLRRTLAQITGRSEILRTRWVQAHGEEARAIFEQNAELLEKLRPVIQAPARGMRVDCEYLLSWIRREFQAGRRVVTIDPITLMQGQDRRFLDHERFIAEAENLVTKFQTSLICVTHPRKGKPGEPIKPCLENIPCSAQWDRCSDSVFWLTWHGVEEGSFKTPMGMVNRQYNRTLYCLKARLDENPGRIAYHLDGQTLRHQECGVIE